MTRRAWLRLAISIVVAIAIAAALAGFGNVKPAEVLDALGKIGLRAACIAVVAALVQMTIILTRLWFLFPAPRPSWPRVAHAFSLGEVVNNFLPARAGDLLKITMIAGPAGTANRRSRGEVIGVLITEMMLNV